jgi:polyphenol oxidase
MPQTLFTARSGGVSSGEFTSLNLALHVGDSTNDVMVNRERLALALSQSPPIYMNQVHGNLAVEVTSRDLDGPTADAIFTSEIGLPLVVLSADCLPILISAKGAVAAIHAGRAGLINGVIANCIQAMREIGAAEFKAQIGPAICASCYEVDLQMYLELIGRFPKLATDESRHTLDLRAEAKAQLEDLGVSVSVIDICTVESQGHFSYRRDGKTGRNAGTIVL